jgi:hypothetical protein
VKSQAKDGRSGLHRQWRVLIAATLIEAAITDDRKTNSRRVSSETAITDDRTNNA